MKRAPFSTALLFLFTFCCVHGTCHADTIIGNFVWRDSNRNGQQDSGEPGLEGITVQLWNPAKSMLIDSTLTDSTGHYSFVAPSPADYRVRVVLPETDWFFTTKNAAGVSDLLDTDINPSGSNLGFTDPFTVAANLVSLTSIDAGLTKPNPVTIGNKVWSDDDNNGRQHASEPGIPGVTVQLWNSERSFLIDSTTTSTTGTYRLIAPDAGDYRVRVVLPSTRDSFTTKAAGSDPTEDSDFNGSGAVQGFTDIITIGYNVISNTTIDAGLLLEVWPGDTIGNRIFFASTTGLQQVSDPTLSGISSTTVELQNLSGAVVQTTTSRRMGYYLGYYGFAAPPGFYRLRFINSAPGTTPSPFPDAGTDDTLDSDIDRDGYTPYFLLSQGQVRTDIDAGFVTLASLGNLVWRDTDSDGVQDAGEPGIPGVTVELWNADRTRRWDSTVTNADGNYNLLAPGAGDYRIWVLRPHPADSFSPLNAGADITKDSDIINTGGEFGYTSTFTLGTYVISIIRFDAGIIYSTGVRRITPLRITALSRSPAALTFNNTEGGTYLIERSTSLNAWTAVGLPFVTSTPIHTATLPAADMLAPANFWRVRRTR